MKKNIEKLVNAVEVVDISTQNDQEWQQSRLHGHWEDGPMHPDYIPVTVTGSEAGTVVGWNKFDCASRLAAKKAGILENGATISKETAELFRAGHIFEPFVGINFVRYMKEHHPERNIRLIKDLVWEFTTAISPLFPILDTEPAKKAIGAVRKVFGKNWELDPNMMYRSKKYPWAIVDTDGFVWESGDDGKEHLGVFEAKTTSSFETFKDAQDGFAPRSYVAQCMHTMAVMGLDFVYLCICKGWTINPTDMVVLRIERNDALIDYIMGEEKKFTEAIELGLEPDVANQSAEPYMQYIVEMYGKEIAETASNKIELPETQKELVLEATKANEEVLIAKDALKNAEDKKAQVMKKLVPVCRQAGYASIRTDDNTVVGIKFKFSKTRDKIDEEKLKADKPDLYKAYVKEVLDTTKFGKENAELKKLYTVKGEIKPDGDHTYDIVIKNIAAEV